MKTNRLLNGVLTLTLVLTLQPSLQSAPPPNLKQNAPAPANATAATQAEAVRKYPELGKIGSAFNREFVARVKRYQTETPAFFKNPTWPLMLAEEVSTSLGMIAGGEKKTEKEPEDVLQLRRCIAAYVRAGQFGGFYDYENPGRDVDYAKLEPAKIQLPSNSWPLTQQDGLNAFLDALKRLHAANDRSGDQDQKRMAVFTALLKLFDDYPFLKYQFYLDKAAAERESRGVQNNIFVQFMSRRLLILVQATQLKIAQTYTRQVASRAIFPITTNGRAGAALFEKHGILLVGFGIRGDVDPKLHREPLGVKGWKSTQGPLHGGGLFDYGFFPTEYIEEVTKLFDLIPPHLIGGGAGLPPMTIMTCHGYYYIYEMEDFAEKYFPAEAHGKGWLGHQHGQDLNVAGPAIMDFSSGVAPRKFRTRKMAGGPEREIPAHGSLTIVAHEITHYLHTTITHHRPEYTERLNRIIALGIQEKSNIRAIDLEIENFVGLGIPAWDWFKNVPQESIATVSNVFYVDPVTVLKWCAALAANDQLVGPLNHVLWFIDAHSMDPGYRETEKAFLLTLQPTGRTFNRIDCVATRDEKGRVKSLTFPGSKFTFSYDAEGFAHLAN